MAIFRSRAIDAANEGETLNTLGIAQATTSKKFKKQSKVVARVEQSTQKIKSGLHRRASTTRPHRMRCSKPIHHSQLLRVS